MSDAAVPIGSIAFLSWARQGLAGRLLREGSSTLAGGRLQLPLRLRVAAGSGPEAPTDSALIDMPVSFHGPTDVVGIDARQVIRCEPVALASSFEPNLFASIEFDRPDLPWMFSPTAPLDDAKDRWQPWITLIVVSKGVASVQHAAGTSQPLPSIDCPVSELPPLDEAWAWAHVQINQGSDVKTVADLLAQGAQSLSRLVAPRRLDELTTYVACVVPTYELGRRAGLGLPSSAAELQDLALDPAWPKPSEAQPDRRVVLPVYYHWEFTTGAAGDFELLAKLLKPRPLPDGVGVLGVNTSRPGWAMPAVDDSSPTGHLSMQGALRPLRAGDIGWPPAEAISFTARLTEVLNKPNELETPAGPLIGPPIYGQTYARSAEVLPDSGTPSWLRDLNLKPEHRIAAGLGALVVRFEQEPLMSAAWDQLAAYERDNAQRKRQQLSQAVQASLAVRENASRQLQRRSPRQSMALATGATLRRLSRPGTAWQRQRHAMQPSANDPVVSGLLAGTIKAFAVKRPTQGIVENQPLGRTAAASAAPAPTELDVFAPEFGTPMSELLADYFPRFLLPGMDRIERNSIALLETNAAFVEAFMVGLNHEMGRELLWRRFPTDLRGSYFRTFWNRGVRSGAPAGDAPRDITSIADWCKPPVTALGTHSPKGAADDPYSSVFLIRGDLLQRYPRAAIYIQRAAWQQGLRVLADEKMLPSFHVAGPPGIVMVGFDRSTEMLRGKDDETTGDAGWFFVLQELPGEPRFGLDAATDRFGQDPAAWRDLSWSDVAADRSALASMRYLPIGAKAEGLPLPVAAGANPTIASWGSCSSEMALITQQLPARLAIHARSWLDIG